MLRRSGGQTGCKGGHAHLDLTEKVNNAGNSLMFPTMVALDATKLIVNY